MRLKGTESRELPCRLTRDELFERADRLSWQMEHRSELEHDHKAAKERMKGAMEDCDGSISNLSKVLRSRAEFRTIDCQILIDDEKGKAFYVRTDTGEVIAAREIWESEKQLDFGADNVSEKLQFAVDEFFSKLMDDEEEGQDDDEPGAEPPE